TWSDSDSRCALTVMTLRSTSRSMLEGSTPGRSNSTWNVSPSRQASMSIRVGRVLVPVVPNSCCVTRSSSRNGPVLISIRFLLSYAENVLGNLVKAYLFLQFSIYHKLL